MPGPAPKAEGCRLGGGGRPEGGARPEGRGREPAGRGGGRRRDPPPSLVFFLSFSPSCSLVFSLPSQPAEGAGLAAFVACGRILAARPARVGAQTPGAARGWARPESDPGPGWDRTGQTRACARGRPAAVSCGHAWPTESPQSCLAAASSPPTPLRSGARRPRTRTRWVAEPPWPAWPYHPPRSPSLGLAPTHV